MTGDEIGRLAIFGVAGLALGGASLASLRFNTRLYMSGDLWRPIGLHIVRLAVLAAVLIWAAHAGAGPLIAIAAGLVLARPLTLRLLARVG
ncbi:hypothetical protein GGQ61_003703 [Phenylobacterium haematophilum]|jgi:hypothetical protein|uniref:ATP synthase subunit I n=1 Tax=Phenylobacterium haematophilum TaxID=98513 RepID=A0A840A1Y2_9CAUL|nr:ATP synthase subunit I [Phenylobacterium haematophilum]MBB3892965.1 hypothetical protein [Phenylobacterium haematophilum]